jgi:site-specific recombinase XerD
VITDLVLSSGFDAEYWRGEITRDPRLKSQHTRRGYLADLAAFEAWRAGRPASKLLVEQYAAELQVGGLSSTTINRKLSGIRWYARRIAELMRDMPPPEGSIAERSVLIDQAERIASVVGVRGDHIVKGRHISSGELAALMAVCEDDPTPAGLRDAALIALAWSCGLRRDELGGLTSDDWQPGIEDGEGELTIHGKGDKTRVAYIYNGSYCALIDWLQLRGAGLGPLFCAILKSGKLITTQRLHGEALRQILAKRLEQAGIKQPTTWHDFRRSFAGNLLDGGADLVTVQRLMGHSSPTTTANYDRRGDEVKRKAIKTLHVPYRGRLVR